MAGLFGKIIFDGQFGIKYAKHKNEKVFIKKEWLDLSDEGIIKEYNSKKEDENIPLFDVERRERLLKERPWEINNIDDIKEELVLTYHGVLSDRFPTMILLNEGKGIEVANFKVAFCKRDCFRVEYKKTSISLSIRDLMKDAANDDDISYTSEPDFD